MAYGCEELSATVGHPSSPQLSMAERAIAQLPVLLLGPGWQELAMEGRAGRMLAAPSVPDSRPTWVCHVGGKNMPLAAQSRRCFPVCVGHDHRKSW